MLYTVPLRCFVLAKTGVCDRGQMRGSGPKSYVDSPHIYLGTYADSDPWEYGAAVFVGVDDWMTML
jgi:hypothetical protein